MRHQLETYTLSCKFAPMGRHPCTPDQGTSPLGTPNRCGRFGKVKCKWQ